MAKAVAITRMEKYRTEIKTGSEHILIADEPFKVGGRDSGASPTELLAASLAACSTMTMKMYADRKKWPLEEVDCEIEFQREIKDSSTTFRKKIIIKGDLDEEQRKRIFEISKKCPVHRILSGSAEIESQLLD